MGTLELLKIFTEPQRLRILHLLRSAPLNVNEIVEILHVSQSNISHHIKILKNLGLVELRKSGNQNYYYSSESPNLPESVKKIWLNTVELISELPEAMNDERNLVMVLGARSSASEDGFEDWRQKQPDLPFTHEFTLAGLPQASMAVDIGCGNGDLLPLLRQSFRTVIGIDLSIKHMFTASNYHKSPNVQLVCSDAMNLPLSDHTVDTAYYRMTLGFIKEREKALDEAFRIVKPGGRISIIDQPALNKKQDSLFSYNYFANFCKDKEAKLIHYRLYQQVFICTIEKN
ncbi:MAG: metalloregulator ArsR/SmtB family transcription factor [Leptospirales bacterium]